MPLHWWAVGGGRWALACWKCALCADTGGGRARCTCNRLHFAGTIRGPLSQEQASLQASCSGPYLPADVTVCAVHRDVLWTIRIYDVPKMDALLASKGLTATPEFFPEPSCPFYQVGGGMPFLGPGRFSWVLPPPPGGAKQNISFRLCVWNPGPCSKLGPTCRAVPPALTPSLALPRWTCRAGPAALCALLHAVPCGVPHAPFRGQAKLGGQSPCGDELCRAMLCRAPVLTASHHTLPRRAPCTDTLAPCVRRPSWAGSPPMATSWCRC